MHIVRIVAAVVLPFALMACDNKAPDSKATAATSASAVKAATAATGAASAAASASAAPAKSGAGW